MAGVSDEQQHPVHSNAEPRMHQERQSAQTSTGVSEVYIPIIKSTQLLLQGQPRVQPRPQAPPKTQGEGCWHWEGPRDEASYSVHVQV